MASISLLSSLILLLLLHLSSLSKNIAAKHSHYSDYQRHHARNPRLQQAYIALQAWKRVIYSDPYNFTSNWVGSNVCKYKGVYCTAALDDPKIQVVASKAWKRVIYSDPYNFTSNWVGSNVCKYKGVYCTAALDDPKIQVVASIDLNSADIAGFLPCEFSLLTDLTIIHLNSNRFCGILPETVSDLSLLYEVDLSNNRFVGPFPSVVLSLPELKFLDIRYNEFEGSLPPQLLEKALDAIFVNNRFTTAFPNTSGKSSASVLVIANNNFHGCLPPTIANFADSLEELLIINTSLTGCLPPEVGNLYNLKVLDVSYNNLAGPLPYSLAGLAHLEQLNLAHNPLTGLVPQGVCALPNLATFNFSYNFFCEEEGICTNLTSKGTKFDDRRNCLPEKPLQRSGTECSAAHEHPVDCSLPCCDVSTGGSAAAFAPALAPAARPLLSPSTPPSST